jgi:O-antigen/teichoic acid export membrane protein
VQLDSFTILIAGCALLVLLGAVFVVLWLRDRTSPWLLWWGLPFVLGGAALTIYVRPGWDTEIALIALGNASRIFALGCLWLGLRVFQHRKSGLHWLAGICLFWMLLCCIPWSSSR